LRWERRRGLGRTHSVLASQLTLPICSLPGKRLSIIWHAMCPPAVCSIFATLSSSVVLIQSRSSLRPTKYAASIMPTVWFEASAMVVVWRVAVWW
jgi:hypothetical protein